MIAPIVDDPYTFGLIAATNCISDIYAMGGQPLTAMNIVAFPSDTMDINILGQILRGALDKLTEAGVSLVGGHSVRNDEIRFGLSITGTIHPDRIMTKGGARAGDKLIITKPVGTGILTTVIKAGMLPESVYKRLVKQLVALNDKASRVMMEVGANAATDITGFGLLGHLGEMAERSGLSVELDSKATPLITESVEYARMGLIPEGMYANWEYRQDMVDAQTIDEDTMAVLYDPQTSGGLLMAVTPQKAGSMVAKLHAAGMYTAAVIGRMVEGTPSRIKVL